MHKKIKGNPLLVVFLTIFVDMLGYGILIPVIPLLLADPNYTFYLLPSGFGLKSGYIVLGYLTAIYPLMQFFATPILGELSDKFGRKPILAISLVGTCLSYLIFALGIVTKNIPLLFLSRGFDGITGGNISVAYAAMADFTAPKDRAKTFGLIGAAFGLGFILGPYIGGKLSDPSVVSWFDATTPFLFAAVLSLVNIISVIFLFPETLEIKDIAKKIDWTRAVKNIMHAYGMRKLRVLFTVNFLFQAGFTFFTTFFSIYLITKFHFTQGNIGDFFSYIGIWIAVTQIVVTRIATKYFNEQQILRVSLLAVGVVVLLYFLPRQSWQILLIAPFMALFIGLTMANLTALVSRTADASVQGEVLGINSSVQALAQVIPPILSGYLAATLAPETPILVSAITLIFAGLFFVFMYKKSADPEPSPTEAAFTH